VALRDLGATNILTFSNTRMTKNNRRDGNTQTNICARQLMYNYNRGIGMKKPAKMTGEAFACRLWLGALETATIALACLFYSTIP
jgi:hypothetical protein